MLSSTHSTPTHDYPVLVIDDDMMICRVLMEVLAVEGYTAANALIAFDQTAAAAALALTLLQHADRPSIILVDPTTFGIPGTEILRDYLQDESQRQPHLLYLITALIGEDATEASAWLHADGIIAMPFNTDQVLAIVADGERILHDRAATPPDPFALDC